MAWRVGVDSGGTFTDVCLFDEAAGQVAVWKVASTPGDPSQAIADGLEQGLQLVGSQPGDVIYFGHGTTVATNALIQHRGVRTGLITTDGFRDLLEIARQKRPDLYDLQVDKPPTLVPRDLRLEVAERVRHDGSVETPLDHAAVRAAARTLRDAGAEAIAICFLYSFLRPEHEEAALRIVQEECPGVFVTASHRIAPEFREYERLSTAVVNAYLGPVMQTYIGRLEGRLSGMGVPAAPNFTQSNGGVIGAAAAAAAPVRMVLSGPATGVVGAQAIGAAAGFPDLITFDMGGTSTDVSLLQGGQARLAGESVVHGYPIKAPMLDINAVGAGGGSVAYVDSGGLLKVGPRSAGAEPGPACYGLGNPEATVTDANVVLGNLHPTHLLGGRMPIQRDLAAQAVERLAGRLGMDLMATAQGIISVVTANMARAIRVISVQRGHDPRDYTLMAFGGAGPLHAARLARELDIGRVLAPRNPGILCAMGLLLTDLRADFATTRLIPLDEAAMEPMRAAFTFLSQQAAAWFAEEGIGPEGQLLTRTADMRYAGQNYEIAVPLPPGPVRSGVIGALAAGFAEAHRQLYGFVAEGEAVQLVTFRVEAAGLVRKAELRPQKLSGAESSAAQAGSRRVWLPELGALADVPVYDRARLHPGNVVPGPAIVEQMDSTTLVLPGSTARVDAFENLVLEAGP